MSTDLSKYPNGGFAIPKSVGAADLIKSMRPPNMAECAVDAIYEEIADFEAALDAEHEVGMPIVGGPASLCVHVREVYRLGTG